MNEDILILAIESSCDETAASVVRNGREILSNTIFSQIDLHTLYGGVVPEIASRKHIEKINQVIEEALRTAGVTLKDIDAIAVTYGPGLVGALLTGVNCMKGLSFAAGKPLIPGNHIEGHVSANYLTHPELEPPFVCLVVSGGHSHLVRVSDYGKYELLGQTVDDAAGEAFDKAARVLGLPYPGGPRIDRLAEEGNPLAFSLPKPHTDGKYDYSFSGLSRFGIDGNPVGIGLCCPAVGCSVSYFLCLSFVGCELKSFCLYVDRKLLVVKFGVELHVLDCSIDVLVNVVVEQVLVNTCKDEELTHRADETFEALGNESF